MPTNLFVCEGMDNTGKTTLWTKLNNDFKFDGPHSSGPPDNNREMFDRVHKQLEEANSGKIILHDRIPVISDQVYSPVIRGTNPFMEDAEGLELIEEFKQTNHLIIYCRPSRDIILGFEDGRDQMPGVHENASRLLDTYDMLIAHMIAEGGWNIVVYDYTQKGSYHDLKERISEELGTKHD